MRTLTDHITPGNQLNESLKIVVQDEPGAGGACHHYLVMNQDQFKREVVEGEFEQIIENMCSVRFQNGPLKENGLNGISQEALLTIVIDRLRGFQSGEFKCRENAVALTHLETAMLWLHKRTIDRMNRGV